MLFNLGSQGYPRECEIIVSRTLSKASKCAPDICLVPAVEVPRSFRESPFYLVGCALVYGDVLFASLHLRLTQSGLVRRRIPSNGTSFDFDGRAWKAKSGIKSGPVGNVYS